MIQRRLLMGGGGSFVVPAYTTAALSGARSTIDSGATYKAFPGMTMKGSTLYFVYRDASAHNAAGGVVRLITMSLAGSVLSGPTTIATPAAGDDNRDPTILALASGRLLCTYHRTGTGGTIALDIRVRYSDDDGASWTSEYTIPDTFTGQCAGSSQSIQLPSGTILLPGYGQYGGGSAYETVVWRSTDNGATFGTQTVVLTSGSRDYYELQIRRLLSGTIVGLNRTNGAGHTWRTVSTDNGVTWSAATDVLTAGYGRPDFVEIWPGVLLLLIRLSTASDDLRWTTSTDDGLTWIALAEVDSGETRDSMYCAPVVISSGSVVMGYSLEVSSSDADLFFRSFVAA